MGRNCSPGRVGIPCRIGSPTVAVLIIGFIFRGDARPAGNPDDGLARYSKFARPSLFERCAVILDDFGGHRFGSEQLQQLFREFR